MTIGEKIKELRRKNDLTQEKLADYLNVSSQAVSKWECGIASPDLALIAPLTKLLHVSADELLGLTVEDVDARKKDLEEAYQDTWKTGDVAKRYEIAKTIVEEYPDKLEYLQWLAEAEGYYATHNCDDPEEQRKYRESAVKHYEMIIEDSQDADLRNQAMYMIVSELSILKRYEEAAAYARQHPSSDELLMWCLGGEEAEKHLQSVIEDKFNILVSELVFGWNSLGRCKTAEAIIKAVIDDGNYLYYHNRLFFVYIEQAACFTKLGRLDEAVETLKKASFHAEKAEKVDKRAFGNPLPYTCAAFDRLTYDSSNILKSGTSTTTEDFREYLTWSYFDPLRDREDFKELLASKMQ